MHLKTVKLCGFKSFVDLTLIPIQGSLNAIVGPNGCGKSNVVDAIRWVIGEISAKQLRGQSMNDVIFNGTDLRKPVGKASIELHFDNSDGRVGGEYAKYAEILIRREVYRDGQSNYFINGIQVRRRDIVDIFLGTGLGPRSYAIVEQGTISNLIEAKPEDLRFYIEETAGISKYKERRRETENRMKHTQENLERVNDICEELNTQLRHLKRQAKVAEQYKIRKEEESLLSAQIKALQWKVLQQKLFECDQIINEKNILQEQKQSDLLHTEAQMEKIREQLAEINEQRNAIQKRYYSLGADIARLEQQIKDTKEQRRQSQIELEESNSLWEELQGNVTTYELQISELETEVQRLKPSTRNIHLIADQAKQDLAQAETNMHGWHEKWETFQATVSQVVSQMGVIRTKKEHYEKQLADLEKRKEQLEKDLNPSQLEHLRIEIAPLTAQAESLNQKLKAAQEKLQLLTNVIAKQRDSNQDMRSALKILRNDLQIKETRMASLEALQKAVLGSEDNETSEWVSRHGLKDASRLGRELKVNSGWERAIETVLSNYFDAICVDNISTFIEPLSALSEGHLTLVEKNISTQSNNKNLHLPTLSSQIDSHWSFQHWLDGIYIAETLSEAREFQPALKDNESIITREGIWLGPTWVRFSKVQDLQNSFLLREQQLKELKKDVEEHKQKCDKHELLLKMGEDKLNQQEADREVTHRLYQKLSTEITRVQTSLSAKQVRLDDTVRRQEYLSKTLAECQQHVLEFRQKCETTESEIKKLIASKADLEKQREKMIFERDQYRQQLTQRREYANEKRKEADELEIRLVSAEDQLNLLKQTVSRDQRQLKRLAERREVLSKYLSGEGQPLESLDKELQSKLEKRLVIEKEIQKFENQLENLNQLFRELEKKRSLTQRSRSEMQKQLEELLVQRQSYSVRQMTIQEQLKENNLDFEQIIAELPENASISVWQQKLDQIVQQINRMGAINLAAIEEYQNVNERKNYLDKQHADLTEALDILKNAIRKIDQETRTKFRETYEEINRHFQSFFPRIFGGGKATLEMTESDLLTTGVVVHAQPPGKRNVNIHMLSGGEKALTAIALVFSLFQLNPAPFCILDEVDAPLDDINVSRFCNLVKEMSKEVQFLIISHNKVTIEIADYLMGVTMQEPGVSRVVSVNMNEAIGMVETV